MATLKKELREILDRYEKDAAGKRRTLAKESQRKALPLIVKKINQTLTAATHARHLGRLKKF